MRAKYRGTCSGCGGQIVPGSFIYRNSVNFRYMHVECSYNQEQKQEQKKKKESDESA